MTTEKVAKKYQETQDLDIDHLVDAAVDLMGEGKSNIALHNLNKVLSKIPDHKIALYNKGMLLYNMGEDKNALLVFNKLTKIDPKDADALFMKGNALSNLGREKSALSCYLSALKLKPNDVEILANVSSSYFYLGKSSKSMRFADMALKISPNNMKALQAKVNTLLDAGKSKNAFPLIRKMLSKERKNPFIWFCSALCMADLGYKEDDVLDALLVTISLDPSYKKDLIPVFKPWFKKYLHSSRFKRLIR